jgi:pimeloyl-ACP methyl ester carboxylesterase
MHSDTYRNSNSNPNPNPAPALKDNVTGEPLGCHYGSWDYTNQIDPSQHQPPKASQPPLLLVHGTADTTVPFREAIAMQARANATGLRNRLIAIPGAGHVPQTQLIEGKGYLEAMLEFLVDTMRLDQAECPSKQTYPHTHSAHSSKTSHTNPPST